MPELKVKVLVLIASLHTTDKTSSTGGHKILPFVFSTLKLSVVTSVTSKKLNFTIFDGDVLMSVYNLVNIFQL